MTNNSELTVFIIRFDDSRASSVSLGGKNRPWATRTSRFSAANKLSSPQCPFLWQIQPAQPLGKPWHGQLHHLLCLVSPRSCYFSMSWQTEAGRQTETQGIWDRGFWGCRVTRKESREHIPGQGTVHLSSQQRSGCRFSQWEHGVLCHWCFTETLGRRMRKYNYRV